MFQLCLTVTSVQYFVVSIEFSPLSTTRVEEPSRRGASARQLEQVAGVAFKHRHVQTLATSAAEAPTYRYENTLPKNGKHGFCYDY